MCALRMEIHTLQVSGEHTHTQTREDVLAEPFSYFNALPPNNVIMPDGSAELIMSNFLASRYPPRICLLIDIQILFFLMPTSIRANEFK